MHTHVSVAPMRMKNHFHEKSDSKLTGTIVTNPAGKSVNKINLTKPWNMSAGYIDSVIINSKASWATAPTFPNLKHSEPTAIITLTYSRAAVITKNRNSATCGSVSGLIITNKIIPYTKSPHADMLVLEAMTLINTFCGCSK